MFVPNAGFFADRWKRLAEAYGLTVRTIDYEWGTKIRPDDVAAAALAEHPVKAVLLTQSETSTGVIQPVEALARVASDAARWSSSTSCRRSARCRSTSTAGGSTSRSADRRRRSPPRPASRSSAISDRAWEAAGTATNPRFYFDWAIYRQFAALPDPENPWTPAISVMQGLHAALELYFQDGVEAAMARHRSLSRAVKEGAQALGLDLFGEGLADNWTVTAIRAPEGCDADTIASRIRSDFGVVLAPGQGPLKGKVFRIGHFGYFSELDILRGLAALEMTLERLGYPVKRGRGRRGGRGRLLRDAGLASRCASWSPRSSPTRASSCCVATSTSTSGRSSRPATSPRRSAPYEALIVRSQTQVTRRGARGGATTPVVARAGIGLDNVDVEAATRRGVMVVNAPQSNVDLAPRSTRSRCCWRRRGTSRRRTPRSNAGRWERAEWEGVELAGKTIGVIGLGRVGALVAHRAAAFGMRVIAYDPYVSSDRAKEMGVDVMPTLEALLVQADFVTIHLPRTRETEGLIGEHELSLMKPGARLVNTARGGIVDEDALAKALEERPARRSGARRVRRGADRPTARSSGSTTWS